jgi:hypothetical protein
VRRMAGPPRATQSHPYPAQHGFSRTTSRGNQGRPEIAAGGGAGRRSAKVAAAPDGINRAKRTTRRGRSTPPRGAMSHAAKILDRRQGARGALDQAGGCAGATCRPAGPGRRDGDGSILHEAPSRPRAFFVPVALLG